MNPRYYPIPLFVSLFFYITTFAQVSSGGIPQLYQHADQIDQSSIPDIVLPALDVDRLRREEAEISYERIAVPMDRSFSAQAGRWIAVRPGQEIWTIKITVPKARGILLTFSDFELPNGSRMYLLSEDGKQTLGAYTSINNKESRLFTAGFIEGESLILTYESIGDDKNLPFSISNVYAAYKSPEIIHRNSGFGESLPCHININCDLGSEWQQVKRGIVRIMMVLEEGVGYCSGSLINNTAQDATPYILSAYHCQDGYTPLYGNWRFDFNYEGAGCDNPDEEPSYQSLVGCQQKAGRQESDFLLLELNSNVPSGFNPYFNGWSRFVFNPPMNGTLIHHPIGDIKKISQDTNWALVWASPINWNTGVTTPPNHHFRMELDQGTFELGSSGSPHFNENMHIVGQLHGGNADCGRFIAYTGRFALSWGDGGTPETQLRDWLDPIGADPEHLDGYEPPVDTTQVSLSGTIRTAEGDPIAGVAVSISPQNGPPVMTGLNGQFSFTELPRDIAYGITASKLNNPGNGVSTIDLVSVRKHILNIEPFVSNYQTLAADADGNGSVSTIDIVHIRKIILNIESQFPNGVPSWKFDPPVLELNPVSSDQSGIEIIGVKTGDLTGNADPGL